MSNFSITKPEEISEKIKTEVHDLNKMDLWIKFHEHAEWLMRFMDREYQNDFELIITPISAEIRSKLTAKTYLRPDMWYEGYKNDTEEKKDESNKV